MQKSVLGMDIGSNSLDAVWLNFDAFYAPWDGNNIQESDPDRHSNLKRAQAMLDQLAG